MLLLVFVPLSFVVSVKLSVSVDELVPLDVVVLVPSSSSTILLLLVPVAVTVVSSVVVTWMAPLVLASLLPV